MIVHELLRELLHDDVEEIREIAEHVPNEIVYRALIIREFMAEHGISDMRQGIRRFHDHERARLRKLGFLLPPPSRELSASR